MGRIQRLASNSIKVKLIALPLLLLCIAISGVGIVSVLLMRHSALRQLEESGFQLVDQAVGRIGDNAAALDAVNQMIEDRIRVAGQMVIRSQGNLSNAMLTQLAEDLGVHELHWFTDQGEIIYSTVEGYLGWVPTQDHPLYDFMLGSDSELMEDVREDTEFGNLVKYGAIKDTQNGTFVQVGIIADAVQELTDEFSYERLINEIAEHEGIVYAQFIDNNLQSIAHSDSEKVGSEISHQEQRTAVTQGNRYATVAYDENWGINVYDILVPVVLGGQIAGAVNLGISMDNVSGSISQIIYTVCAIGLLTFAVLGVVMTMTSMGIVKTLDLVKNRLNTMASGDLSGRKSDELPQRKDEFGEIASAIDNMQSSFSSLIGNVVAASRETFGVSQQLSASMQQTSASIEEVASTANEFAHTVEDVGQSAMSMAKIATQISGMASSGGHAVEKAISSTTEFKERISELAESMGGLSTRSKEIGGIVEVISDISAQTDLLALNAAIESARAGEHGRGFAVVAEEVRRLAEQSARAAHDIAERIEEIQSEAESAVTGILDGAQRAEMNTDVVQESGVILKQILESVDQMTKDVEEVVDGLDTIRMGSGQVAAATEEQSATIQQVAALAQNLNRMSENLNSLVKMFKS